MATKNTSIHELARAEIERQQAALRARDDELTAELARLYQESRKGHVSAPVLDSNQLAARQVAAKLPNGSTPPGLGPTDSTANIKQEQHLMNERAGVRLALKILSDKSIEAAAVASVQWLEANRAKWRELIREVFLTAVRSNALTNAVDEFIRSCPDPHAVRLELAAWAERPYVSDKLCEELVNDAIEAGVVSPADVAKAKKR
jgi:hypothetical protein